MEKETLNIAILPSDGVMTQAIAMSDRIAKEVGSRFTLNLSTLIPHITIYQAQYPSKNIEMVKHIARSLALEQELFEIELNAITVSHGTFLIWNCERTKILQNLQSRALKLANTLREGLIPTSLTDVKNLSKGDQYDVKHYGALLIGPRYKPHITITRLNNEADSEKAIKIINGSKNILFKPKSLILGYLGEHGTVTGIAESFSFK